MWRNLACDFWSNSFFPFSESANPVFSTTLEFVGDNNAHNSVHKGFKILR